MLYRRSYEGDANPNYRHGWTGDQLYVIWTGMKQRCNNPNHKSYFNYGGRGIKVSEVWLTDADVFICWAIDHGWKSGLVLDRIDNDKGYSPDNCRVVSHKINANNKRNYRKASGLPAGVTRHNGKFQARFGANGKQHLGTFNTVEEAADAYQLAKCAADRVR